MKGLCDLARTEWPVFLSRVMYEDSPVRLRVGDRISWNAILVDGCAEGFPSEILVETSVRGAAPPEGALGGLVARTPELTVAWGGTAPEGSRLHLLAGLVADWFNPPFQTIINASIRRLYVAWQRSERYEAEPMRLVRTDEPISSLRRQSSTDCVVGLVAELAVASSHVAAFAAR
jgi:hypothetical protein